MYYNNAMMIYSLSVCVMKVVEAQGHTTVNPRVMRSEKPVMLRRKNQSKLWLGLAAALLLLIAIKFYSSVTVKVFSTGMWW